MKLDFTNNTKGISHCITHWSVFPENDRKEHKILGIPENEAIVQLIACGTPPEENSISPVSPRRPLDDILARHSYY